MNRTCDVVVIGGGPAGATVGTLLARAGLEVELLEAERFPRFHVGESLIPAVNLTLERLGVMDEMDRLRFPQKHGVQFFSPNGPSRPFYFSESADPRLHQTWQVLRSDFDELLLDNAQRAGVKVRTGARATRPEMDGDTVVGVRIEDDDGSTEIMFGKTVIDASGQNGLLAQRLGERRNIPGLENVSVFAHYDGAVRDPGIDAGSTLIFRLDGRSWLWSIPLPDSVSIGLVAPAQHLFDFGEGPSEILDSAIAACEPLSERIRSATRVTDVHMVRDFSYLAERDGGAGWLLVGDALGFIDPIYSSGLFLTLLSGELAAKVVESKLNNESGAPDFGGWSGEYRVAFDRFLTLVQAYYREGFRFGPLSKDADQRQGLIDLLIGDVATPSAIRVVDAINDLLQSS